MGVNERRFSPIRRWNVVVVVVFFSRNVFVLFFFSWCTQDARDPK